jgi:fructose-1-phosphate kinase PfkB-like protein
MSIRGDRVRARVWCFTPNPVFETKIDACSGRVILSAGGKAHNVAKKLTRWGVSTISVICDGGAEGVAWMDHAKKEGVKVFRIPVRAGMRQGWAWLKEGVERIDFFTEDLKVGKSSWRKIRDFWIQNCKSGDWWVVAGSSATGWPKGWWKKLIGDLQKKGVSVLVDSRGALLREAVQAGADWIKCNLEEAKQTTGLEGVDRCIRSLMGNGTTGVLVTSGKDGLAADVNGSSFSIPAPKVRVKDPTGSGDVVTAAVIYGEIQGWGMKKTFHAAALAGAWNASKEVIGKVTKRALRD